MATYGRIFFQSYANPRAPLQLFAAYIPNSEQAVEELEAWILSKLPSDAVIRKPNSEQSKKSTVPHLVEMCFIPEYAYSFGQALIIVGHYESCIEVVDRNGGIEGGGGATPEDTPCSAQLLPTDDCPGVGDTQCPPPYLCGGSSTGGSGGNEDGETKTLREALEENEYLLLEGPCEEIENYEALAEYAPPEKVMDKLKSIEDNFLGTFGDFSLLAIENASGTVVNMDEFSVNIKRLPNGMTASELLQEIRLNINNFINTDYSEFSPYNEFMNYPHNETKLWNSDNPLGAIIHIGIPNDSAIFGDDGSVIVSDYSSNSWTFSTISAPYDWDHPVSGNRKFGFTKNNDGSYTFYTKGVDRFTQKMTGEAVAKALSNDPFSKADNLWKSFQQGIKKYVNNHGGTASINDYEYKRPDWYQLKRVFNGLADKETIGCE